MAPILSHSAVLVYFRLGDYDAFILEVRVSRIHFASWLVWRTDHLVGIQRPIHLLYDFFDRERHLLDFEHGSLADVYSDIFGNFCDMLICMFFNVLQRCM